MARSKSKNVGIIGLGIIGSRIAAALRKRNLQVFVWNRTPKLEQNFVGSPAEVAEVCNVIQIFVADDEALLEVVRQLSPALNAHHIITAHCTVAPESMRAAAELALRRGARFLDAPFTGSKMAAENGQLVYYIAGDEAALKQVRPILEASSKEIVFLGEKIGDATVMKVATNLITAATAQVAAEALALVRKAGIAPELFTRAMKSNASNSTTIEMKVPMMLAHDFDPHFSVKHMLKDVRIGLKMAENYRLQLPATTVSREVLLAEMKQGRGDADYASVAQRYFPAPGTAFPPELEKIETPEPVEEPVVAQEISIPRAEPLAAEKAPEPTPEAARRVAPSPEVVAAETEALEETEEGEALETGSKFTVIDFLREADAAEVTPPEERVDSKHEALAPAREEAESAPQSERDEPVPAESAAEIVAPEIPSESKSAELVAEPVAGESAEEPKPIEAAAEFQSAQELQVSEAAMDVTAETAVESKVPATMEESNSAEKPAEPKPAKPLTERLNIDALLKRIGLQKSFATIGSGEDVAQDKSESLVESKPAEVTSESAPAEAAGESKPIEPAAESERPAEAVREAAPAVSSAVPELADERAASQPTQVPTEARPEEIPAEAEATADQTQPAQESTPAGGDLVSEPKQESRPEETSDALATSAETENKPEPQEEEIPEGVNLSGGFRGWLSRRFRSSSRREF